MLIRQFAQYILGLVFLALSGFVSCNTEFTYNLIDTGIEITGCYGTCPEELLLPTKINEMDVTNIADNAFKQTGIKKIVIPNSTNISSKSFAFNPLLEVTFLDELGDMSEDAFLTAEYFKNDSLAALIDERSDVKVQISNNRQSDVCYIGNNNIPVTCNVTYTDEAYILYRRLQQIEGDIYYMITSSFNTLNAALSEYSSLKQNYDSCASDDSSCILTAAEALYKYSHCDENDNICIGAAYRGDDILRDNVFYYCSNSTSIDEKSIATSKSYFYELTQPYSYGGCYPSACSLDGLCTTDCGGRPPFPLGSELIERVYTHSATPELNQSCDDIFSDNPSEIIDNQEVSTDYSIFDIDQNGSFDALTDGLIILRYAFGLRGDSLISNSVASDANRTSAEAIEAHIESHMP